MYDAAYARPPTDTEVAQAIAFLQSQAEELGVPAEKRLSDPRAWADLAHALMNTKEFVFLN